MEQSNKEVREKLSKLRQAYGKLEQKFNHQELLMDDWENQSRRNNIKIRGVLESFTKQDLPSVVLYILNCYLDKPPKEYLEIG